MRRSHWTADKQKRLDRYKERLALYENMEEAMLNGKPYSYTVGSRNKTNYNMSLSDIRRTIAELEQKIAALEAEKEGRGTSRTRAVIPRDV
jgi:DNA mismatch repair ATPase MutS